MPSVISGDANVSATEFGYLDGVTSALQTQMDAKAPLASPTFTGTVALPATTTLNGVTLAGGKILQIVRATDTTSRSTTSATFVDVTGMSVTITPQKSDSAVIILANMNVSVDTAAANSTSGRFQITDSSNNAISGAENTRVLTQANGATEMYFHGGLTLIGYATPATTSAVTYKVRFRRESATGTAYSINSNSTGQIFAIEVSA